MSEERPAPDPSEEEQARSGRRRRLGHGLCRGPRRRAGPPPRRARLAAGIGGRGLKKLVDTVADKLSGLPSPLLGGLAGPAAQQMVRQVVQQADRRRAPS